MSIRTSGFSHPFSSSQHQEGFNFKANHNLKSGNYAKIGQTLSNRPYSASTSFTRARRSIFSSNNEGLGIRRNSLREDLNRNRIQNTNGINFTSTEKNDSKHVTTENSSYNQQTKPLFIQQDTPICNQQIRDHHDTNNDTLTYNNLNSRYKDGSTSSFTYVSLKNFPNDHRSKSKQGEDRRLESEKKINLTTHRDLNRDLHEHENNNNLSLDYNSKLNPNSSRRSSVTTVSNQYSHGGTGYNNSNQNSIRDKFFSVNEKSPQKSHPLFGTLRENSSQKLQRPITAVFKSRPQLTTRNGSHELSTSSKLNPIDTSFRLYRKTESSISSDTSSKLLPLSPLPAEGNLKRSHTSHSSVHKDKESHHDPANSQYKKGDDDTFFENLTPQTPKGTIKVRSRSTLPFKSVNRRVKRKHPSSPSSIATSDTSIIASLQNRDSSEFSEQKSTLSRESSLKSNTNGQQVPIYSGRSYVNGRNIGSSLNDFTIIEEIGSGGCGIVYKVRSKLDQNIYVAKKINVRHLSQKQLKDTLLEVYLMKDIHHEHIIRYYTSFVDSQSLYIIMEHAEAGDLHQYYRQQRQRKRFIKESLLWKIMLQTCLALQYLHNIKHIIHRDVKPLNLFLSGSMQIKLGDLGMSRFVEEEQMLRTNVGTPAFLSPEQIRRRPYDFKVDVWGLGCVMYSLAALRPPFKGDNILELSRAIVQDEAAPIPKHYTLTLRSLIHSMLSKTAYARPSVSEILASIPEHIRQEYEDKRGCSIQILGAPFTSNKGSMESGSANDGSISADNESEAKLSHTPSNAIDYLSRDISESKSVHMIEVKQPKSGRITMKTTRKSKKPPKRQEWI